LYMVQVRFDSSSARVMRVGRGLSCGKRKMCRRGSEVNGERA